MPPTAQLPTNVVLSAVAVAVAHYIGIQTVHPTTAAIRQQPSGGDILAKLLEALSEKEATTGLAEVFNFWSAKELGQRTTCRLPCCVEQ